MIVDAHQHFWDPARGHYPFLDDVPSLRKRFGPEDLHTELESNRIDGSIVVQARSSLDETEQLLAIAEATPWVVGVVGWVDLTTPDDVASTLAAFAGRGLVGIRHQVHDEPDPDWIVRSDVQRSLRAISDADLAFDLLVCTRELPAAIACARGNHDLRFILDHVGKPPFGTSPMAAWRDGLAQIAQLPNLFCKLSGLLTETPDLATAKDAIREAVELFGPERCMFGSDWPVCLLAAGYADSLDLVRSAIAPEVVPVVLAETAARAYRLELR
jgi:L-fucono-1,5-lactonase